MMKRFYVLFSAVLLSTAGLYAADGETSGSRKQESAVKQELRNHFKFYGFVRNFFTFDTRESVAGTGDLFYILTGRRTSMHRPLSAFLQSLHGSAWM